MFLILLLVLICTLVYFKFINPFLYWRKRNIFYVAPWSKGLQVLFSKQSLVEVVIDAYQDFPNRRYYGSFQFLEPSLFVRDLDLIKSITVKDFDHFTDHFRAAFEDSDPIFGKNLLLLKGQRWKELRSTLSPAFTSSKMRAMFSLMVETAGNFTKYCLEQNQDVLVFEMRELFAKFTNDVIANCAFGVKCDSLQDPNNEFIQMGKLITSPSRLTIIRAVLYAFFYRFFIFFRIPILDGRISEFFRRLVKETIATREKQQIVRPDMIHLLMEARKGRLKNDLEQTSTEAGFATVQEFEQQGKSGNIEITDDFITAQAVVFFLAGFSSASALMSFIAFELATNPDCQDKLQREIDETFKLSKGQLIYEQILKMKYLDQVVTEALRKWPPAFALNRVCVKDYVIQKKNDDENTITIEKGCTVVIPVVGIQLDPNYFPDPHRFNPDRFSEEKKASIVPGSYLPFGAGPRNCIGSRFALLEVKALMVSLLSKFEIITIKETRIPIKLCKSFTTEADGGVWLGLKRRPNNNKLNFSFI